MKIRKWFILLFLVVGLFNINSIIDSASANLVTGCSDVCRYNLSCCQADCWGINPFCYYNCDVAKTQCDRFCDAGSGQSLPEDTCQSH
jgi:hypothetical protein